MINIISTSRYKVKKNVIEKYVEAFFKKNALSSKTVINIVFVGQRKMKEVANTYKHENVPLPVLAFPYKHESDLDKNFLGEVILCYPQVVLLAAERGKRVDDMTNQLIEHGIQNLLK